VKYSAEAWQAIVSGERQGLTAIALRGLLTLASAPYGVATRVRNALFDRGWKKSHRVGVPVVSIGNLTMGGTGKTPCVEYVAGVYRDRGLRPAILSRGYGAEHGPNDEAMLLEENLPDVPHLQNPDRVEAATTAIEELEAEVLVLDDGFQHRRLARDLDIALIDATNPWGFGHLFPRGALRESRCGLKRAHVAMVTRADRVNPAERDALRRQVAARCPGPIAMTRHAPRELLRSTGETLGVDALSGRNVIAFAGIGNPAAFRRTLDDLGAVVVDFRAYPDHHGYTRSDVDDLSRWAERHPAETVIATTQKDLVKLRVPDLAGRALWAVRIGLEFLEGRDAFDERLMSIISPREQE
jgi:tetraacyldisaccharide 4'-kinase